jgi:hypothetical protein
MTEMLTFQEAALRLPVKKSTATVKLWCRRGLRGVRLETTTVGGSVRITVESLERFLREVAAKRQGAK